MRFVDTDRFSPVAKKVSQPWEEDYFHTPVESLSSDVIDNSIIDENWWYEQYDRCINGYEVEFSVEPGGDAIVDGVDAIWHGNDVYLPEYDHWIRDRKVKITGRHYFYLNFWIIYGMDDTKGHKGLINPRFLDMDYLFFLRIECMKKWGKDSQELKGRQMGFSEKGAGGVIGYNFIFVDGSLNVIVGGIEDDALKTMRDCRRGLDRLENTQFFKELAIGGKSSTFLQAKHTGSQIHCLTAKDNPQTVSRFCLAKGTKVVMYDGRLEKVENLKLDDQLMGIDSTPRNIKKLNNGVDEMYRISSAGTDDFVCNSEHLLYCYHKPLKRKKDIDKYGLYVQNNFNDPDVIPVDDTHYLIKAKDYFFKSKTFKKHTLIEKSRGIEFEEKEVKIDPYLLGLWIGDGDSEGLRITSMDIEIDEYLNSYAIKNGLNVSKKPQYDPMTKGLSKASRFRLWETRRNGVGGVRQSSILMDSFRYYNLFNNKHIPDDYKYNTRDVRLQVLAGLLDTDGWKNKNGYGFAQVSDRIANDVKYLCYSLGFNLNIKKKNNGTVNGYQSNPIWDFYIYGENIGDIPLKIKRKKQPNFDYKSRHPYKYRMSIEKVDEGEYYGFGLDGDQLFLLEDFTITHNSPYWVWFEEIGKGKKNWSIETAGYIKPSIEVNGIKSGYMHYIGTGGEMEDGVYDLEERHYKPDDYNILSFKNNFDDQPNKNQTGYFTSKTWFYKIDKDGNSLRELSKKELLHERSLKSAKERFLHTTQYPIYANEVFYTSGSGYFGEVIIQNLNERAAFLNNHRDRDVVKRGHLEWISIKDKTKGVKFIADPDGPFEIMEHPEEDHNGLVPLNLYYAGTDSYDQDVSTTDSEGAIVIRKKFYQVSKTYNKWVAKLLQRPSEGEGGADRFYENTALLCAYYSARNLIEFTKWRIIDWYDKNGCAFMLKERPTSLLASFVNKSESTNRFGIDAATKRSWLNFLREKLSDINEINRIDDIDMLRRFAKFKYDPTGKKYNCDLTIATALSLIHEMDEEDMTPTTSSKEEVEEKLYSFTTDRYGNIVSNLN